VQLLNQKSCDLVVDEKMRFLMDMYLSRATRISQFFCVRAEQVQSDMSKTPSVSEMPSLLLSFHFSRCMCRARENLVCLYVMGTHITTCQGLMQGYTLTGRTALFPSYESFLGIVHTMMVQYSKFVKLAKEVSWRNPNASINYIETSTWARQEHNGFSHQNPSFIGAVLNLKPEMARVYLPPDANCFLSTVKHCLGSRNYTNLIVGSKQPTPVWLSPEEADAHCGAGASVWKFASTDQGKEPDVVLVGIGTEVTFEVVAAAALLRKMVPELRVRVVNVIDLMILGPTGSHPHALSEAGFEEMFTRDKAIVVNYHGYVNEVAGLVFGRRGVPDRMTVKGYREEGRSTYSAGTTNV
jgi:xylulose-5-phosphate/fructose-6-phosphate phosphoketolase